MTKEQSIWNVNMSMRMLKSGDTTIMMTQNTLEKSLYKIADMLRKR